MKLGQRNPRYNGSQRTEFPQSGPNGETTMKHELKQPYWTYLAAIAATAGILVMLIDLATAQTTRNRAAGTITVQSQSGNGQVTGRVRIRNGVEQVQLPGGTWMDCFAGCDYTLRTETIDFWDKQIEDSGESGQGGWGN